MPAIVSSSNVLATQSPLNKSYSIFWMRIPEYKTVQIVFFDRGSTTQL